MRQPLLPGVAPERDPKALFGPDPISVSQSSQLIGLHSQRLWNPFSNMDEKVAVANGIIPPRGKLRSAVKISRTYLFIENYPTIQILWFKGTVFAAEFRGAL